MFIPHIDLAELDGAMRRSYLAWHVAATMGVCTLSNSILSSSLHDAKYVYIYIYPEPESARDFSNAGW